MISGLRSSIIIPPPGGDGEGHEFTRAARNGRWMRLSAAGVSFFPAEPQGLKPSLVKDSCGTAKAVPFPVISPRSLSAGLKPRPFKADLKQNCSASYQATPLQTSSNPPHA